MKLNCMTITVRMQPVVGMGCYEPTHHYIGHALASCQSRFQLPFSTRNHSPKLMGHMHLSMPITIRDLKHFVTDIFLKRSTMSILMCHGPGPNVEMVGETVASCCTQTFGKKHMHPTSKCVAGCPRPLKRSPRSTARKVPCGESFAAATRHGLESLAQLGFEPTTWRQKGTNGAKEATGNASATTWWGTLFTRPNVASARRAVPLD